MVTGEYHIHESLCSTKIKYVSKFLQIRKVHKNVQFWNPAIKFRIYKYFYEYITYLVYKYMYIVKKLISVNTDFFLLNRTSLHLSFICNYLLLLPLNFT